MWPRKNFAYFNQMNQLFSKCTKELELYGDIISPPVRFVQMTAAAVGIKLKMNNVDLFKAENRSDSFMRLNPLGKVPVLKAGELTIADSHAIALFLCENYGGRELYPPQPAARAAVQQLMFFNCSTLFPIDSAIYTSYFAGSQPVNENQKIQWRSALDYLELLLRNSKWLAGEKMTLCDLCCGATVSTLEILLPTTDDYANVNRWITNLNKVPCFEVNTLGLEKLRPLIHKYRINC